MRPSFSLMACRTARRRAPRERWVCHPALAGALLLVACNESAAPEPLEPPNIDLALPWTTASVADVGGSAELVPAGLEKARANDRMLSLLVVKNGRLVVEEYFGRAGPADLHDMRSVTKSVVSALTGIVIDRGYVGHVDSPIGGFLDSLVSDLEPEKAAITVENLLTMTSGLEWDESGGFGDYSEWIRSDDHIGYLLDKPLVAEPGTRFTYNSAAVHLLGVVLEQATGMRLPEAADELLFSGMGIARSR
ncbi:MAG: serine hydrolase [Gemmatimonadetes bacterium]|nr:serine hydrolase [Gemmatimonadota bacterium]